MLFRLFVFALAFGCANALTLGAPARVAPRGSAVTMAAAKIRMGDMVKVLAGDDKGKVAKVIMIDPKKMMVTVEGVNIMSKNVKPMKEGEQGRIVKREVGIHMSNVSPTGEKAPVVEEAAPAAAE